MKLKAVNKGILYIEALADYNWLGRLLSFVTDN